MYFSLEVLCTTIYKPNYFNAERNLPVSIPVSHIYFYIYQVYQTAFLMQAYKATSKYNMILDRSVHEHMEEAFILRLSKGIKFNLLKDENKSKDCKVVAYMFIK